MSKQYIIGTPFHFEMEMSIDPEWNDLLKPILDGKPDLISIDGIVVHNDGEIAIIRVISRFMEFDGVVHYFDETIQRFPNFKDPLAFGKIKEYLWVRTSENGFDAFIPNDEF